MHERSGEWFALRQRSNEEAGRNGLSISMEELRGFEDTQWIRLRPVTVFIGPNNSGKTSLIAPLLILKQSYFSSGAAAGASTERQSRLMPETTKT